MSFGRVLVAFFALLLLSGIPAATTVILNSLEYQDIVSANIYARANGYSYVFSLTPNQTVFITKYYTQYKAEPIIYIEGKRTVLPNMEALLRDSGALNVTTFRPDSVPDWVADQFPKTEAIVVGSQYGQDALSVSPYAALAKKPVFFIGENDDPQAVLGRIKSKGYASVLFYGPVAHQIPASTLATVQNRRSIDTGSRYSNNLAIVAEFIKLKPTTQVMFVSGRTMEKSMVDTGFPLILMGRSDVAGETGKFISDNGIVSGVVFAGDADIVDSVTKLRASNPKLSLFAKFGEGYLGNAQPLPLTIIPLPSPLISLEIVNISYNVQSKLFEVRVKNNGAFASMSAGISVPSVGSGDSTLISLDPGTTTTVAVPIDASRAVSKGVIPEATLTMRYGEDAKLLDNIDSITYTEVPTSSYSDSSTLRVVSFAYNPETKSFELVVDGSGYVEGTVRFSINDVPYSVRVANSKVDGPTTISTKLLLNSDEQSFINGISADYALRYGGKSDVLLRESRGSITASLKSGIIPGVPPSPGGQAAAGAEGGFPWLAVIGVVVLLAIIVFAAGKLKGARGGDFE